MASVRGQSTGFLDALSGLNGMADPVPARLAVEVMADPTALPSVVDSVNFSTGLPSAVVPGPWPAAPPPPAGPAFIAPAPPLFTPTAIPRPAATRPAAIRPASPPGRRPNPAVPPAARRPLNAANVSYAPTPYAQPFAPSGPPAPRPVALPPRPGLPGQLTALQSQLRQQAQAGRGRRPPKKKSSWGGVLGLLVFVFLFLVGSGLFAKILDAIEQVLHR